MESFAATFPRIAIDSTFKGWFVSTLLLFAWFGSLINGPLADWLGRKARCSSPSSSSSLVPPSRQQQATSRYFLPVRTEFACLIYPYS